jgi:acetolactate synthase I/II/III large subunit
VNGTRMTAGEAVVEELLRHSVDRVFAVPGESYLAVLDALHEHNDVELITCRHEAGAANMAEAYGKLTSRPGVCFVSRGPGATHASIGCHTAQQDGTPLILFIGDVPTGSAGRESFQEVDFSSMFASLSKRVLTLNDASRVREIIGRAFRVATSGRPGPVVVVLPEDLLRAVTAYRPGGPLPDPVRAGVPIETMDRIGALLESAARPLLIVGGSGWTLQARNRLLGFAERAGLPVAAAFRSQDVMDNEHPNYVGHLGFGPDPDLVAYACHADVVLAIGTRLDSPTTGDYTLWDLANQDLKLVHLFPDPDEIGRVYQPTVAVPCTPAEALEGLDALAVAPRAEWKESLSLLRASYDAWRTPQATSARADLGQIVAQLSDLIGEQGIITTGAGNYTAWVHRHFSFRRLGSFLGPRNGAMGYGLPAAIAAKLLRPEATVVAFAGDGCFMMAGHELATAVHYQVPLVVLLINNGMYGTIRMHQEVEYPGRPTGTALTNPNFTELAAAYGCHSELVECTEEFMEAFKRALASGLPSVIEIRTDPNVIAPGLALDDLRTRRG